jgi:hypothetical protein
MFRILTTHRGCRPAFSATKASMTNESVPHLKRASASRPSGEWNEDDFDVLAGGGYRAALSNLPIAKLFAIFQFSF